MLNSSELKVAMLRSGYNQITAAAALHMNPKTFGRKMKTGKFGLDEMDVMIDLFNIEDPAFIFFGRGVTSQDTN